MTNWKREYADLWSEGQGRRMIREQKEVINRRIGDLSKSAGVLGNNIGMIAGRKNSSATNAEIDACSSLVQTVAKTVGRIAS